MADDIEIEAICLDDENSNESNGSNSGPGVRR